MRHRWNRVCCPHPVEVRPLTPCPRTFRFRTCTLSSSRSPDCPRARVGERKRGSPRRPMGGLIEEGVSSNGQGAAGWFAAPVGEAADHSRRIVPVPRRSRRSETTMRTGHVTDDRGVLRCLLARVVAGSDEPDSSRSSISCRCARRAGVPLFGRHWRGTTPPR